MAFVQLLHGLACQNKATNGLMAANDGTNTAKRGPIFKSTRKNEQNEGQPRHKLGYLWHRAFGLIQH
jgi:hypothetical protein